ncbi:MAG TPA: HAD family phosphatase [Streptosporangiaceae bacterium]
MPGSPISAVAFDLGGVLIDWDPRHLYRQLFADPAEMEFFLDRICTSQWHLAHDLGADITQSCEQLAWQYPVYREMIMAWALRGEEMAAGQIDGTVEVLRELIAAGLPCYALSNMEPDTFAVRRERFAFMAWFSDCVISGIELVAKPDPLIFQILLRRGGLQPQSVLFIDDQPANVRAAGEAGLTAIQFISPEQLRRDLRAHGLAVAAP